MAANSLGYNGFITCNNLHRFTRIDVCAQEVSFNGPRLIRNLCPGTCNKECTETTTAGLTAAPTALSCENNQGFRTKGADIGATGWISCKHLHKYAHLNICAQEVQFKGGPTMILDLCPGKCHSACCVDVENLYLQLQRSDQKVACHKKHIGPFCHA